MHVITCRAVVIMIGDRMNGSMSLLGGRIQTEFLSMSRKPFRTSDSLTANNPRSSNAKQKASRHLRRDDGRLHHLMHHR